ncbi:enoyl-CoA hydratase/isomerase family protein [Streptomyces sp. CA-251387]|uniref:enoyl-CoA hydratase/isomerase family protein n=1 Tax=Streptomyces sp. CA-251387 TaxID=3240064 RepID=UPI003D9045BD
MLTGTGARFSAGLDLGEAFPLLAGDPAAVASWFQEYRATNMRLFTYPRPTEVPIGVPMPAVYARMLAHSWGEPVASRACLRREIFTPDQAHALGMVHELAAAEDLLDQAVAVAGQTPEDCMEQYAFTKRACRAAALRDIAELAEPPDEEQQLKGRPAPW